MKRRLWLILLCVLLALVIVAVSLARRKAAFVSAEYAAVHRLPHIRPDYTHTVIPPNIAPLNFLVQEPGTHYRVNIYSTTGEGITILSRSPNIVIPPGPWKELLEGNRGEDLLWDIYVRKRDRRWYRFDTITITIAREDIDSYLVYRLMELMYKHYAEPMVVCQRDLGSYDETVLLHGESFGAGCLNCHTFHNNRTDRMTIGIRPNTDPSCTLIGQDGVVTKVGTKFGYTSWHPSGRLVAYSLNKVTQFVHFAGVEMRGVLDLDSDLVYYEVGSQTVKTTPAISDPDRLETYPTWSPDGRYLYFCSAPILWADRDTVPPEHYDEVRYDLLRIGYDIETDTWGEPETVLSSAETGLSILLPRISPDGRLLLVCMCEYGCFPISSPSSDLYLMDLETGEYRCLEISSGWAESWHSWSSNSRWFAFSSKRRDGFFSRLYLSYVDEAGKACKPVLLPQKDPGFYDSFLKTYNTPELVIGPAQVSPNELAETIASPDALELQMPDVSMTRKTGGAAPWTSAIPELE